MTNMNTATVNVDATDIKNKSLTACSVLGNLSNSLRYPKTQYPAAKPPHNPPKNPGAESTANCAKYGKCGTPSITWIPFLPTSMNHIKLKPTLTDCAPVS
ncbi:MAG: hypothetical protein MJ219_00265 [Mycoplasmoidaceae bacterium]|nr:hypothetical protein [Mycoplasmoidaceae bacterium]